MPKIISTLLLLATTAFASSSVMAQSDPRFPSVAPSIPLFAQSAIQDFGAVIDIRRIGADGATVLAVSPGGAAERMGLRHGDRILSINGQPISSTHPPATALRSAMSGSDHAMQLEVRRDGEILTLKGGPDVAHTRSISTEPKGCGYVSVSGAHPRATRRIFPSEITRIDGKSTPLFTVGRYRVDAGRRVLIVDERIDDHRFSSFGLQERQRQNSRQGARRYKVLIVDVAPDTRYDIGAQLMEIPPDVRAIRDNTYWEPVVWRSATETCR